jgi:hypothetical protein
MALSVVEEFRRQARNSPGMGSPFNAALLDRAADDLASGGVVAELVGDWPGNPAPDLVSLRLAGALHAAVLSGRAAALAEAYPARAPNWSMIDLWPRAEAFLNAERDWVRAFMASPPQTNEVGRAAGLAAGFFWVAARAPGPFRMLELGASAGLNLHWDQFRYAHPPWERTGVGGPLIPTAITGAAPAWRDLAIGSRAGCDQNPLDPSNAEHALRLKAYVWADQGDRLARLDAALKLAAASPLRVEKADAAEWIARQLSGEAFAGTTIVYHSIFFQYPPPAIRAAITEAIEAAGRSASAEARLAWVRLEPASLFGGKAGDVSFTLSAALYGPDGREECVLADADPHGRTLGWRG